MKPLYTQKEFNNSKSNDKLACKCYYCNKPFYKSKNVIQRALNPNNVTTNKYCSRNCLYLSMNTKINVDCKNCNKSFLKKPNEIKKSPNHFCSKSCAATHNNKNKSYGNRRSKLENWLEEQLTILYPTLNIDYNQKLAINSELDIYISSLNIAFELNGIFHYEPIFGVDKLSQIKENDISKSKACYDAKIDLCIIDTSQQKYVKPSTSQKYLDIITNIIKERI